MKTKFHWVHAESGCAGIVESERMLDIFLSSDPCVSYVSEENFEEWVANGCIVHETIPIWLVNETTREKLFEQAINLKVKADELASMFQNEGVCIRTHYDHLLGLQAKIIKEMDEIIKTAVNECREVK